MFARTRVQSRWWRLFALASSAIVTPLLFAADSTTEWVRSVATAIALFGLIGYAFGFRLGPRLFWVFFAIVFCTAAMVKFGSVVAAAGAHKPLAIVLALAMFAALSLALFRHAELVGGGRQADANILPEPLFPSRAQQWRVAHQRMAEARAAMDQPMSASMQHEALSFGSGRQLSLKQHQRAISIMFVGSFATQVGLTIFRDGNMAILIPAAALAIGCAVTTYLSAEVILKAQERLASTWKGVALVLALTTGLFLVSDQTAVGLWLVKAILSDVTALALGNVLVSGAHALARRR